ncbi:hypothetical protein FRC10_005233 [Ceratobasidium sp. 414]|nr:hypothetical protein FRC10_005233 [Ceratobasidium sp. 414]
MKLSSSNLALATLALSPSLLSSPVFAAPTPDVGGFSPNPNTGYFADPPQPQVVDSPLLQGTPTFSGAPAFTGTPPASKIAGRRRSIRRSSARFRAAEPTPGSPGLGLGLGIGLFGSSVHIRSASSLDPTSGILASEGLLDNRNPLPPASGVAPTWLDPHDTLPENLLGSSGLAYPQVGREESARTTEYPYTRDAPFPLGVEGLESPFLNSPVPHDAPTFPPAVHKRQAMTIPGVGALPLVGSLPGVVPGIIPGSIPLTGLPLGLGPNGLPIPAPNLDTHALPLPDLGGTGLLPSPAALGSVSPLLGTAGINVPGVPNVNGLPLIGGLGTMVTGAANGLGLGSLPLSGVSSTVDQVLRPITYPLAVLGENPSAAHGLVDPASELLSGLNPSPYRLQETGEVVGSRLGGLVQGVQGMVPGVETVKPVAGLIPVPGGLPGVDLPGVVPGGLLGVNLPGGVAGTNLPGSVPGLGPILGTGALPISGAGTLPVSGSVPLLVPTSGNQPNQAATIPGVLPNPIGAVPGMASVPTGNGVLGGQSIGLGGVTSPAPGLAPGVGTLPVSIPGANSLPVPSLGQLNPIAPFVAIPGSLGPVSQGVGVPVVPEVMGASGALPSVVGTVPGLVPAPVSPPSLIPPSALAPGLIPSSVPMHLPAGMPLPDLVPKKGDLGVPSTVADEDVVGIYKATGGVGAMGRPDEVQANVWKDGSGAGKDEKEVETKEEGVDGKGGQGETMSEASSSTAETAEPSHTLSTTPSGTHSWAAPTGVANLVPSGTVVWSKDGTPTKSAPVTESPSSRPQVVKQATPMPVAESLTAWAGLARRASPVPDVMPTSFTISVPPAHATATPLSIATASPVSAPPSALDHSNSSASNSDDGPALPIITVTEPAHPTAMYHGGSPLSRVPEIASGRLAPAADATRTRMDALPSVTGLANPMGVSRWGMDLPKMTTSVVRAAAPTQGQTN